MVLSAFSFQKTLLSESNSQSSKSPSLSTKHQHQPSASSILESLFRSFAPGMSTFRVLYNLEVRVGQCGRCTCVSNKRKCIHGLYHVFHNSNSSVFAELTTISGVFGMQRSRLSNIGRENSIK